MSLTAEHLPLPRRCRDDFREIVRKSLRSLYWISSVNLDASDSSSFCVLYLHKRKSCVNLYSFTNWCEATTNANRTEDIDSQSNSVHILSVKSRMKCCSFPATKRYKNHWKHPSTPLHPSCLSKKLWTPRTCWISYTKPNKILYSVYPFVCRGIKHTSFDGGFHGLSNEHLFLSRQTNLKEKRNKKIFIIPIAVVVLII
jgi:hypothetical protein